MPLSRRHCLHLRRDVDELAARGRLEPELLAIAAHDHLLPGAGLAGADAARPAARMAPARIAPLELRADLLVDLFGRVPQRVGRAGGSPHHLLDGALLQVLAPGEPGLRRAVRWWRDRSWA